MFPLPLVRGFVCRLIGGLLILSMLLGGDSVSAWAAEWTVTVQRETAPGTGRFHRLAQQRTWEPARTAIIVCDMWDSHHGLNAVRRVGELAPRIDRVLKAAREQGVTIIHAPSGCMEFYRDHPARSRAVDVPQTPKLPAQIDSWCKRIPVEERALYPIDQADGGEDDDLLEHKQWAAVLKAEGRDPRQPWQRQTAAISIDPQRDYISDRGAEIWSILQHKGIRQVVLCGVHTNMCVLGRPFGLRQMVRNEMPVVLIRDLTDTMYNPRQPPYVSHFSGTDLIVEYIERYICPTITSDTFLPNESPFRFRNDRRRHIAIVMSEDEYETRTTLTEFAKRYLQRDYRVSLAYADVKNRNIIPGLNRIRDVDLLILSSRRRTLPQAQLDWFRKYIADGKPLIAIRTSSHAFHLRKGEPPAGHGQWPTFDHDVLGGNYHDHYSNKIKATVTIDPEARTHPLLAGVEATSFPAGGSLYKTTPLRPGTFVLATGKIEGHDPEPIAWTYVRTDGGRTFYSALGHVKDFEHPAFVRMMQNAVRWSLNQPVETEMARSAPPAMQESAR